MSRPQKQNFRIGLIGLDGELPKVGVVCEDDAPHRMGVPENDDVVAAAQAIIDDRSDVLALRSQALHDVG